MKNKLLDSFYDLKCPHHDVKLKKTENTINLYCIKCGIWKSDERHEWFPGIGRSNWSQKALERLVILKEYYDEQSKSKTT
jgi:hypothetical protein